LNCFTKNRISARYLTATGQCAICKTRFAPVSQPLDVDQASFESIVRLARVPVLVAFRASWCAKSRNAGSELRQLAFEMAGYGLVLCVDTDANPDVIGTYNVRSTPSYALFRHGQLVLQRNRFLPRADVLRWTEPSAARAGNPLDSPWPRLALS